ncbi:hypothetical protein C0J52_03330 [Blattella germanica]|nr:hypothetical protein C0J52_03330 [Blattella germanica]
MDIMSKSGKIMRSAAGQICYKAIAFCDSEKKLPSKNENSSTDVLRFPYVAEYTCISAGKTITKATLVHSCHTLLHCVE